MMFRELSEGRRLAISQPIHAWVSGQLARHWKNDDTSAFHPHELVTCAAGLHDIGWLEWERNPTFNPETGWPRTFLEVPLSVHLKLWRQGVNDALTCWGTYPALLISMHGTGLYHRLAFIKRTEEEQRAISEFQVEQESRQQAFINRMRKGGVDPAALSDQNLKANQQAIALWDLMSLHLCMKPTSPGFDDLIPGTKGDRFTLTPQESQPSELDCTVMMDPWPFQGEEVLLRLEGQILTGPFASESAMQSAIKTSERSSYAIRLLPGVS